MAMEGNVKVALTLGEPPLSRTHYTIFLAIKFPLSCNVILGRPVLYDFEAVTSIQYLTMKFSIEVGVGVVQGRQKEARVVYMVIVVEPSATSEEVNPKVMEVQGEKRKPRWSPLMS